jgi:DNA-binding GntR family transcriptional regulator
LTITEAKLYSVCRTEDRKMQNMKLNRVSEAGRDLASQVFDVVQQAIAAGELRPNQRLIESEIAKTLGVSRSPVREALKQLEITGYVRPLPGAGVAVADFSASDIKSLFEVRVALETTAIRLSCLFITGEEINTAEDYYGRCVEALRAHDIDKYLVQHRSFHESLYVGCRNDQLLSLIRIFRYNYFDRVLTRIFTRADWRTQATGHAKMLEAVRNRNAPKAVKALERSFIVSLNVAMKRLT